MRAGNAEHESSRKPTHKRSAAAAFSCWGTTTSAWARGAFIYKPFSMERQKQKHLSCTMGAITCRFFRARTRPCRPFQRLHNPSRKMFSCRFGRGEKIIHVGAEPRGLGGGPPRRPCPCARRRPCLRRLGCLRDPTSCRWSDCCWELMRISPSLHRCCSQPLLSPFSVICS